MIEVNITLNETERDLISQALGFLKDNVEKDVNGTILRKMPNSNDKEAYVNAIDNIYKRFLDLY